MGMGEEGVDEEGVCGDGLYGEGVYGNGLYCMRQGYYCYVLAGMFCTTCATQQLRTIYCKWHETW